MPSGTLIDLDHILTISPLWWSEYSNHYYIEIQFALLDKPTKLALSFYEDHNEHKKGSRIEQYKTAATKAYNNLIAAWKNET